MTLALFNEWLEKQSPAMLEAKRRGLVPQSGDWEHPYRWVTPEEVEEIEAPKEVGQRKKPWEMTQKEFESPAPLPQAKPGNVILYHATEEKNLDSILRNGLDSTRWGGEGPQGVVWGVDSPEGYSSGGVVVGVEIPESQLASVKGAEWLYARGSVSPDAIVYVDEPSETTGKRLRTERDNEYARAYHEWHVKKALADGKPVPDEVLRDYPDLRDETLDKQVASGAVAARERGLVPQSGDWEHPYRWVTPEEVEETEISETDFIVDEDGDKHAFGGGITGPIDLTEQISTVDFFGDERESVGGIWGDEMPRYWYHRPPSTEAKGAEDGGIKAYVPREEASVHYKFREKGTKVVWIAPQPWANKETTSITDDILQEATRGKATRVIDITKLDPNSFSSIDGGRGQIIGDIPIEAIVDSKRSTDKSSSYEMPKYDLSWDTLVEIQFKNMEINIRPIEDAWRSPDSLMGAYIKDTDNFILDLNSSWYFGESEEAVKEGVLNDYISPKGKFVRSYDPPRLTPKPDWATDESDPFPEIPSDIEVIHYDDLPEFYTRQRFGEHLDLKQSGGFRGKLALIAEKACDTHNIHSEIFSDAFKFDAYGDIDYGDAAGWISGHLESMGYQRKYTTVTEGEAKSFVRQLREKTVKSLEHRELPEKFYVFRGGRVSDDYKMTPVSLSPAAATKEYFSQGGNGEPYIAMYEVNRDDILVDVNAVREKREGTGEYGETFNVAAVDEHELILQGKNLKNQLMIQLPNRLIKEEEFRKSKSLDKQAVATSEPPDQSVAARMKARGLEWKKETHRWIRPEDAEEEEEPQIHDLSGNRDEFFDALMERFLDKTMSTEDLTEEQKVYLSSIKNSMDAKADYLFNHISEVAAFPDTQWHGVASNIRSSLDNQTYPQFRVSALDAVADAGFKVDIDSSVVDSELEEIMKLVIRPYLLSQFNEVGDKIQKTIEEIDFSSTDNSGTFYPDSSSYAQREKKDVLDKILGPIDKMIKEMSLVKYPLSTSPQELVDLYVDGVLDINGRYDRKTLNDSLIYSIGNFIDREELEKVLQFSRDNLFKFVTSGDRIGVNNLVSKVYDASSPKAKEFMREALLNSLKDEELVSLIHMNFVSGGYGDDISNETKDVLAGVNHLTLAIYEDMLKNGDIDDLVEFFSDENIPSGMIQSHGYADLPFTFLSEHVSVEEFGFHVDKFLNGGAVLRKAGIEALAFIDPNHPSLLAMVETEENPYIMNHLANNLPVTALEDLITRNQGLWGAIDVEAPYQEAMDSYAKEHEILEWIVSPDDEEGYAEFREQRGEQIAYAEKAVALMRHSRKELEHTEMKAKDRLHILQRVDFDMDSVQSFQSIFKKRLTTATPEQPHLPGMEPGDDELMIESAGQYQSLFDEWVNNLPDDFMDRVGEGFSDDYHKPGLPELFDELYYGTSFGKMHTFSKGAWESSSSSPWGGVLKESVGRQFDDKVIFHGERRTRPSIDEALERERGLLFKPDTISSANFNQENLDRYVRMHKAMTRALLDKVIDGDTVEVFRGTSANELSDEQFNTLSNDDFSPANIQSNSLSSYSLNESTAEGHFATADDSIVINIPELHKDNIWSTFLSHSYEGGEREILVISHSDVDAHVRTMAESFDTDQLNPDHIGLGDIEDLYGTGNSSNEYVDEFSNASELATYISSGLGGVFHEYMDSPQYSSYDMDEWVNNAAHQLMEDAKENYDYTLDIPGEQEEAIEIIEQFGFLGRKIYIPDDVLNNYTSYENLSKNIFDKQKELWEEEGETYVAVVGEGDDEELANEADRIAINLIEWAEQGKEKVSGI